MGLIAPHLLFFKHNHPISSADKSSPSPFLMLRQLLEHFLEKLLKPESLNTILIVKLSPTFTMWTEAAARGATPDNKATIYHQLEGLLQR